MARVFIYYQLSVPVNIFPLSFCKTSCGVLALLHWT